MNAIAPMLLVAILLALFLAGVLWPWIRPGAPTQGRRAVLLGGAITLLGSLALYMVVGTPEVALPADQYRTAYHDLRNRSAQLHAKEKKTLEEWAESGEIHTQLQEWALAARSYKQAVLMSGGNAELILAFGKAQMLAADGTITPRAKQAFEMASTLMPERPEPVFYLAIERMQEGDDAGAREKFKALLERVPEDAPMARMARAQIDRLAAE